MQTRTPRALVAAAALALLAGACTDSPTTAPAARAPGQRASLSASAGPTLVSNAVKYRDTGGKPATGRAGNAVMSAFAVLDREGVTTLSFFARHATQTWREGTVTKAQVKTFAPDGAHKYTRNLEPYFGHPGPIPGQALLQGLGRGDQVRLQANVENVDAPRVDVVTVTETVKRLPDLTVDMSAPAQVEANTYVNVMGVVREANGDLGAFAGCELRVDGQVVDVVYNLWVDAGDAVTCATTVRFTQPGTYAVQMRVRTSWEREWDTENNTDTATIQVNGDSPRFYTSASFLQRTFSDSSAWYESWEYLDEGWGHEYRQEYEEVFTGQYGDMYGYMPARMAGPVSLQVGMSTGGTVVDAAEWDVEGSAGGWCASHYGARTTFSMCSFGDALSGSTSFTYAYLAGSVTYHSREYSRVWDDLTGEESVYHWNTDYAYDELVPLGGDWTFTVRFATPDGEHDLSRTLALEPFAWSWTIPYACSTWGGPEWGIRSTTCGGGSYGEYGVAGYAED